MMAGVVLVPPLVRWVSIHGLEAHFYDEDFALLIQLTGTMMLMALILVTSFQALIRSEESRVAETRLSKRFELIADSLPALIGYVSENERYLFANQTYEKWFGVPTQNVLGKTMSEIIGEQNRGQVHSQIAHAMETQTTTTFDGEMLLVSGKSIFYHADYVPDLDAHGKIQGCIILGTDVTERAQARKDLQASEERLKLAIRGAQMGTWSMSLPGYEIVSDERFRELHNAVDVPDVRANIDMLVHPADRARIASALDHSIRTGAAYDCEYRIVNADGSARWIYARGEPKYDDANQKPVSISGVSFDISERKRIEIKLAEALRFAERANEAKSAFLANMSHEIRTPLGAILGFTELIKDSESAEERSEYAGIIERSGKSLTKIIDDILDLSKVEAGRLELEKINFDVEKTVREVAELFVDAAQKKNLTLELAFDPQTPVKIKSDPTRIRQILINLIGNAVKFTSTGKVHIAVTGAYFENQLTHLRFAITDTGVGLTEEQEHKLFAPFSQADNSTTRKFGGSGLGLALSKRLANALGGDVWVASSKTGEGSTFMATVQADSSSDIAVAAPATKALEKSKTLQGLRVLLVEDSLDNQMLIQKVITRRGGSVEVANNGLEGVLKAQAGDGFDVILMDMQMPILDGYAATEQLRERGYKKPIIALTAHAMAEERKRTEEIGCNAHLTKPLDFELLITTLDRFGRETKDI
jgi:PAS domain S-box-containing protein